MIIKILKEPGRRLMSQNEKLTFNEGLENIKRRTKDEEYNNYEVKDSLEE